LKEAEKKKRKERKKTERETAGALFTQGQKSDTPCWLCHAGFL
jgi:hypothetical protein